MYFYMCWTGFCGKSTAVSLCKSIESAIQWFQTHHRIIFVTIYNSAVYRSGARVSMFPTMVLQLYGGKLSKFESRITDKIRTCLLECHKLIYIDEKKKKYIEH